MNQNRLYVGNIPYTTTEDELQEAFSAYGSLREVRIITDRETGRSRGFAFVTFESAENAETAMQLNGQDLGGRRLVVNAARPRLQDTRGDRVGDHPAAAALRLRARLCPTFPIRLLLRTRYCM